MAKALYLQECLLGKMSSMGFNLQEESTFQMLTQDVIKTSEIKGENLNKEQVSSSIAKQLGIGINEPSAIISRYIEGIVEVMLDAQEITMILLQISVYLIGMLLCFLAGEVVYRKLP